MWCVCVCVEYADCNTDSFLLFFFSPFAGLDEADLVTTTLEGTDDMLESDENDTCSPDEDPLTVTSIGHFTREPTYNQDLLICGVCQRIFALSDILKFIRHKVKSCTNKESLNCNNSNTSDKLDGAGGNGHGDSNLFNAGDTGDNRCTDDEPVIVSSASALSECDGPFNNSSGPAEVRKQTPSIINSSQRHKLRKTQLTTATNNNINHHSSHQALQMQNRISSSPFNNSALINQSIPNLFNSQNTGSFLYANSKSDATLDTSVYSTFNTTGNHLFSSLLSPTDKLHSTLSLSLSLLPAVVYLHSGRPCATLLSLFIIPFFLCPHFELQSS